MSRNKIYFALLLLVAALMFVGADAPGCAGDDDDDDTNSDDDDDDTSSDDDDDDDDDSDSSCDDLNAYSQCAYDSDLKTFDCAADCSDTYEGDMCQRLLCQLDCYFTGLSEGQMCAESYCKLMMDSINCAKGCNRDLYDCYKADNCADTSACVEVEEACKNACNI